MTNNNPFQFEGVDRTGRIATSEELIDFVVDQDQTTRTRLLLGGASLLFDPQSSKDKPFKVVDTESLSRTERADRIDFGLISDRLLKRNENLKETLGQELVVCLQMGPEKVTDMMNRVRAEHNKAAVVEPDINQTAYVGIIVNQCPTQSVMLSEGKFVLLEHSKLDAKPTPNALTRVEFHGEVGNITTLHKLPGRDPKGPAKDQGQQR